MSVDFKNPLECRVQFHILVKVPLILVIDVIVVHHKIAVTDLLPTSMSLSDTLTLLLSILLSNGDRHMDVLNTRVLNFVHVKLACVVGLPFIQLFEVVTVDLSQDELIELVRVDHLTGTIAVNDSIDLLSRLGILEACLLLEVTPLRFDAHGMHERKLVMEVFTL